MTDVLNPHTLPVNDNIPGNAYAFVVEVGVQPWFMSTGAMIAYYGQVKFEPLAVKSVGALVASRFSAPLYARDWVVANGQGKLVLGDRGFDINSYDLDDGNLTIKSANLLAFETGLALKQSIVPGFLTLIGTGKFLASSNGPVMFVEHRAASAQPKPANTNESATAGPACTPAAFPVSTKIPVPMTTPTPKTVSCSALSVFLSRRPGSSVSSMDCSTVLVRNAPMGSPAVSSVVRQLTVAMYRSGWRTTGGMLAARRPAGCASAE